MWRDKKNESKTHVSFLILQNIPLASDNMSYMYLVVRNENFQC